ncbi:glycosyltransferase [Spirillospora sp. NPDC052269]
MPSEPPPRVVVAGGHSAGHIEPAMNLADALRRLEPTAEITALGTVRGLDTTLVPARGYPLELIPPAPLPRKLNRALLGTPGRLRDSVRAAEAVLDRVRAEVVVGFGGYVAMPAYLAAHRRGLPIVIHEANARPGVANRLAARMTTHVFTAAPSVRLAHATAIGIPLRPAVSGLDRPGLRDAARRRFGLRPDGPVLMVTGGLLGSDDMRRTGRRRPARRRPAHRTRTSPWLGTCSSRSLRSEVPPHEDWSEPRSRSEAHKVYERRGYTGQAGISSCFLRDLPWVAVP